MNAPLRNTDHIAHGSPEMLRECAAECLNMVSFYAALATDFVAISDDAGLNYATRQAVAAMRQAVGILAMLPAAKEDGR